MASAQRIRVAITIATYRRPQMLGDCLQAIARLQVPDELEVLVLVVDNDRQESARETCTTFASTSRFPLHYHVEPERGLSSVRNRLLEQALAHRCEWLASIDDDERPHERWLSALVMGMRRYGTDVVTGPVVPVQQGKVPIWAGESSKYRTGQTPRHVSACNVLFSSRLIADSGLRFDRRFDFSGSEDQDFFIRAARCGHVAVWVDEAVCYETIPPRRSTLRYWIYRHYTSSLGKVMLFKKHHSSLAAWPYFFVRASGKVLAALPALLLVPFIDRERNLHKGLIKLATAAGWLAGLLLNRTGRRYLHGD